MKLNSSKPQRGWLQQEGIPQSFAVVDFGTAYAKVIIVQFGPASTWNVVGAGNVCYCCQQTISSDRLPALRMQAAEEALHIAKARALQLAGRIVNPGFCLLALPADIVSSSNHTGQYARKRPLKAVEAKEEAHYRSQALADCITQAGKQAAAPSLWLGPIWETTAVDDRLVTDAISFRGEKLTFRNTVSYASSAASKTWLDWAQALSLPALPFSEGLFAALCLGKEKEPLLLDGGGRRTDIYLRTADGELCWESLPIGGQYFTRWLSLAASAAPTRAERIKLAYAYGNLRPENARKVASVMQRALISFTRKLGRAAAPLFGEDAAGWLINGGQTLLPEFCRLPQIAADASILPLARYPNLLRPRAETFAPLVLGPEQIQPIHIPALGLAAHWLRLNTDPAAQIRWQQAASMAKKAGFEVFDQWLK